MRAASSFHLKLYQYREDWCHRSYYYVYAYSRLVGNGTVKAGEKINVVVPTGNFGNILAAYYAKQMGLPINKLICASNENKVLFDFFRTGPTTEREILF